MRTRADFVTLRRARSRPDPPQHYDFHCDESCVEAWLDPDGWQFCHLNYRRTLMPDENGRQFDNKEFTDEFLRMYYQDWWKKWQVPFTIPTTPLYADPENKGSWFLVQKEYDGWRGALTDDQLTGRMCPPGRWTTLIRGTEIWMSDTPAEIISHMDFINCAHGDVLVNGLGLGLVLNQLLQKKCVESIHVVERDEVLIEFMKPILNLPDKVTIFPADAFDFKPPKGHRYSAIFSDIWKNVGQENLPEMLRLRRKYARHTPVHFCWEEDACLRMREGYLG